MSGSPTVWFVDRSQIHDQRDLRGLTDVEAPSRLRSYKSAECEEALSKLGLTEREDAMVQRSNRRGRVRSYQPQHSVVFPKDSEMPMPQHSPRLVSQVDGWGSPTSARKDGVRDFVWSQAIARADEGTPADPSRFIYEHRLHACDKRPLTPMQQSAVNSPGKPAIVPISPIQANSRSTLASMAGSPGVARCRQGSPGVASPASDKCVMPRAEMVSWNHPTTSVSKEASIKSMKESILYPERSVQSMPDCHHTGYQRFYQWRDLHMKQIDINRTKLLHMQGMRARTEELRTHIPGHLQLNPGVKGVKSPLLSPAPLIAAARMHYEAGTYGSTRAELF
mmetsp:Transcript_22195/g.37048  ORF Transcript_22195/g.37048 Transcript_22195/m.37048 type:complete len:336 (+) Transcript_22195:335-1342(+)|eukprot:CAMPEP_0198213734 /NCGR_PEP_ID=MMETSP1445-20131203/31851_1 /TAXON_ID=36898 /ORGANISM="Pyramimonas sp., Strain CCMP2087" /LENGTH=335 /DNA_ID=CAMNT_0043888477 /DNA_START=112 /DNA_END=1119 /DNA_ORIENTATION=-